MIRPLTGFFAFAFVLAAGPAPAQVQPPAGGSAVGAPTTPPEQVAPDEKDREFAKQAAQGLDTEVRIAGLATKKAESQDVRTFAERAVEDYGKAMQELDRAAHVAEVEVPKEPGPAAENMFTQLDDETPGAFDLAYATQRLTQHQRMVELFEREAENGKSPALRRFAADTLPLLQKNTRALEDLQKQLTKQHQTQTPAKGK
jgi:putative membrane protein